MAILNSRLLVGWRLEKTCSRKGLLPTLASKARDADGVAKWNRIKLPGT